jgi:hypothetical protein
MFWLGSFFFFFFFLTEDRKSGGEAKIEKEPQKRGCKKALITRKGK